jgi:hypothetical protein
MKFPTPYELPDVYQLAALAATISPQLCANRSTQAQAADLAVSLMDACAHSRRYWRIVDERAIHLQKFHKIYNLPLEGRIDYRRAASIITGDADNHQLKRGVQRFEKLLDALPSEDRSFRDSLTDFRKNGVSVDDVSHLRRVAESLGVCAKKTLTGSLSDLGRRRRAKRVTVRTSRRNLRRKSASPHKSATRGEKSS